MTDKDDFAKIHLLIRAAERGIRAYLAEKYNALDAKDAVFENILDCVSDATERGELAKIRNELAIEARRWQQAEKTVLAALQVARPDETEKTP